MYRQFYALLLAQANIQLTRMDIMLTGPEDWFAETPCIDYLLTLGYEYLPPDQNQAARDGLNHVILREIFLEGHPTYQSYLRVPTPAPCMATS